MKLVKAVSRIKLYLLEEDKEKRNSLYNMLSCMARECRDVRNDVMRQCLTFYQMYRDGIVLDKRDNGKDQNYRTYVTAHRRELKFLTGTLANTAEYIVINKFKNELKGYLSGVKGIPSFKDVSLPITGQPQSNIELRDGVYTFVPSGLVSKGYVFGMVNVHKDKSVKTILDRIIDGTYRLGMSTIKKDPRDHMWYLYAAYQFESEETPNLDTKVVCGVDLGWVVPAYCGLNTGYERRALGDSGQIKRFRQQIKSRRRSMQRHISEMKGGHGRARKLRGFERLKTKESDFVKTCNHTISKQIVEFCIKQGAGTIHMEALTSEVKKSAFLSAYWSYYQLQQMVDYKAKEKGITVLYVDPAYTSQMCSACGHIDRNNRKTQVAFKCTKCGHEAMADYNASVNIARSTNIVSSCEIADSDEEDVALVS